MDEATAQKDAPDALSFKDDSVCRALRRLAGDVSVELSFPAHGGAARGGDSRGKLRGGEPSNYSPVTSKAVDALVKECFAPEHVTVVLGGRQQNSAPAQTEI
jgi:hypothetical protein